MKTMPPTTTGPGPLSDPPFAATPLTVVYSCDVLYSQITWPSADAYARMMPLVVPENTTPGIAVIAADCACTHAAPVQFPAGGAERQISSPVARFSAARPPAF